jgi:hypothetical protein
MPTPAIQLFHRSLAQLCTTEPLATITEGHIKATLVNALLLDGHTIIEGSNRKGKGRKIWVSAGEVRWEFAPLQVIEMLPHSGKRWTSPDIRVTAPNPLVVELQVRCSTASSCQLQASSLFDNIDRIAAGAAGFLVLVFDGKVYDALRGQKNSAVYRRAAKLPHNQYDYFAGLLPQQETITDVVQQFSHESTSLIVSAQRVCGFGIPRVITIIYSSLDSGALMAAGT